MAKQASKKPTTKVIAQALAGILAAWAVWIAAKLGIPIEPAEAAATIEPVVQPLVGMAVAFVASLIAAGVAYIMPPSKDDQVVA